MKKVICIVMIAALLALSSAGIAEVTGPAYLGPWICGRAKLDIHLARGKHAYDKRETLKEKEDRRDISRQFKHNY